MINVNTFKIADENGFYISLTEEKGTAEILDCVQNYLEKCWDNRMCANPEIASKKVYFIDFNGESGFWFSPVEYDSWNEFFDTVKYELQPSKYQMKLIEQLTSQYIN